MQQTGYRLAYACQSCGYLAEAQVVEHGRRRTRRGAKRTLALTPCPDCGWRDARTVKRFYLTSALRVLLGASLPLGLGVFAAWAGQPSLALSAFAAAFVAGWAVHSVLVRPQASVEHRVRFLSSNEVALRRRVSSRKLTTKTGRSGRTTSSRLRALRDEARTGTTSL